MVPHLADTRSPVYVALCSLDISFRDEPSLTIGRLRQTRSTSWTPAGLPRGQPLRRGGTGTGRLQPLVRAPHRGHMVGTGGDRRAPLELPVRDPHRTSRLGPGPGQRVLYPDPSQPVGKVANRLVVVEVGLPHPPLRPRTAYLEHTVSGGFHREAGLVDR